MAGRVSITWAGGRTVRSSSLVALIAAIALLLAGGARSAEPDPFVVVTDVQAAAGAQFVGEVATVRSADSQAELFSADVDWGDGTSTAGLPVTATGETSDEAYPYSFRVDASHTYELPGEYEVTVSVSFDGLPPTVAVGTASVVDPAPPPPPATEEPTPSSPPPPPPAPPPTPVAQEPAPLPPSILSVGFTRGPTLGSRSLLSIRARAANSPVTSYTVRFGENDARFATAACSTIAAVLSPALNPFSVAPEVTVVVPYTFRRAGRHVIDVAVTSGTCVRRSAPSRRRLVVSIRDSSTNTATTARATARAAAPGCVDDTLVPTTENVEAIRAATICLLNAERATAGLDPLAGDSRLVRAAQGHTAAMVSARVFAHTIPGGPDLGERMAASGYRGGAGENIGLGIDQLSTPAAMLRAWMNSPPHRANILEADYRAIGVGVLDRAATGEPTPGATYTTNFGTAAVDPAFATSGGAAGAGAGGGPGAGSGGGATGRAPSVSVRFRPTTFRAARRGRPTRPPAGFGTRVAFSVSRESTVTFTVTRPTGGRRVGRSCRTPTRRTRGRRPCTRQVRLGSITAKALPGSNELRFGGRLGSRTLKPGRYRLVTVARGGRGPASKPVARAFRVRR